jgi:TolB-like protein/predicted Ser/Thr protein kinase/Flp pilus assembly protein TadD
VTKLGVLLDADPTNCVSTTTSEIYICGKCGAKMPGDASTSCLACLLEMGFGFPDEKVDEPPDVAPARGITAVRRARILTDFDDYELEEEIGRGGQGVVYRARQKSLNRTVALKVIGFGHWATEAHLKRFRLEAEVAAQLDDPHIVSIYEIGERDGALYFSMKFVEGGQLDKVIDRNPMPVRKAAELLANLAHTLNYAHQRGVLHGDIKPGNILIDRKGEPHLTDFGLARMVEAESTMRPMLEVLGTPGYMAPEQAAGKTTQLTEVTDVYGLGAVFYYLLTCRPPFSGSTTNETVRFVLESEPRQPRLWNPKVDRDLATICLKCLEKDPQRRYASALALAEDLERWLRHEAIRARRSGAFSDGRKWVRRNPTITVLAGSLVALAALVGVLAWDRELPHPMPAGVAVLPFENLSADPENAFFTDGVQDQVLNHLAQIADLKVISRTSVMQYRTGEKRNLRQIANELGVAYVVEGSVQRGADHVRVSAQLIDAKTDTHLWAENYDRSLDDVFAIQTEIAKAIADELQAKLSLGEKTAIEQPPTTNLIAYDRYLRSRKLWAVQTEREPGDMREVIRLLDQAVAYDPTFLLAYCELARAHAYVYFLGIDHTFDRVALAKAARDDALRLGPHRGESHLAAAWVAYHCYLDYETALTEVGIARRTLPNDAFVFALPAYIARRQGHWEQSARNLERAAELDPRSVFLFQGAAHTYQETRRFSEAATALERALAIVPGDATMRVWRAQIDLDSRADTQPMREVIQSIISEDPSAVDTIAEQWFYFTLCQRDTEMGRALASLPPQGIIRHDLRMPRSFFEGLAARARNDATGAKTAFTAARVEMEKIVREQPDCVQALCTLGMSDAALGRKEDALREGRRAVELLPITKDAWTGAEVLTNLAIIYAWVGEKDLAIKQLEEVVRIPSPVSYGQLRLHPFWDPLRGDPRFEKLLEESRKPVDLN